MPDGSTDRAAGGSVAEHLASCDRGGRGGGVRRPERVLGPAVKLDDPRVGVEAPVGERYLRGDRALANGRNSNGKRQRMTERFIAPIIAPGRGPVSAIAGGAPDREPA